MLKTLLFTSLLLSYVLGGALEVAQEAEKNKQMKKAFEYYAKAADRYNKKALYKMGTFYYQGEVVSFHPKKAYKYFEIAHKLEYDKATYALAVMKNSKRVKELHAPQEAFALFMSLAKKGDAKAQNRVGMAYNFGLGVDIDYKEAIKWYEASSKQGFVTAQCNLAGMYANGFGVFPNYGRAHNFAQKGYKQKHPICVKLWETFDLGKYKTDKGFQFNFYNKP